MIGKRWLLPHLEFMLSKEKEFGIDPKRIAIMGISMGGYLAARAVAFEPCISAVILYDGVYDGYDCNQIRFSDIITRCN